MTCPGTNGSLLCSAEPQQELRNPELYQTRGTGAEDVELPRFRLGFHNFQISSI